jgi:pimeloyl-ACP methyl ester carboxylesterase
MTLASFVALLADRGKPVRLTRKKMGAFAREAAARVWTWVAAPWGWLGGAPRASAAPDAGRTPVLVLVGPPQSRAAGLALAAYLRGRGVPFVHVARTRSVALSLQADALIKEVQLLRQSSGSERIDIVAHGIAGLAAAWMIRHDEAHRVVRRLITLGTPWRGTRMAVFTRGPLGRDILPDAPVLDGLAPPPVPTWCIWGSLDPMVLPSASAVAEGAPNVRIPGAGHLDLLLSARVFRAVDQALCEAEPHVSDPQTSTDPQAAA